MKKRIRFLSVLLSLLLTVGALSLPALAAELPFDDVKPGDWYYDAVAYAYENGLFNGTGETTFSPEAPMTRAMFVTVLANRADNFVRGMFENKSSFSDVEKTQWYAPAVEWANKFGLVSGVGGGRFAPNELVSREQMALILYNYAIQTENDTTIDDSALAAFEDADTVSGWAREAMEWAATHGVVKGSDGKINPQNQARRCEVAQVWVNAEDVLTENTVLSPDPTPEDLPEGAPTYQEFKALFPNEHSRGDSVLTLYPDHDLSKDEIEWIISTDYRILLRYSEALIEEKIDRYLKIPTNNFIVLEFTFKADWHHDEMYLMYYPGSTKYNSFWVWEQR